MENCLIGKRQISPDQPISIEPSPEQNSSSAISLRKQAHYSPTVDNLEFLDWRNPLPKGSKITKLSVLFQQAGNFYTKMRSLSLELGMRLSEDTYMTEGKHAVIIRLDNITSTAIDTIERRVA